MSDLTNATRASRRTAPARNSDGTSDQPRGNEDTRMDEVSATSTRTAQHGDKPDATPKPLASPAYSTVAYGQGQVPPSTPSSTSTRITMTNIRDIMEKNAQDITRNLEDKHAAHLLVQQQAVTAMAIKIDELERSRKTTPTTGEQASPFEKPRAERPQDLAY